VYATKKDSLFVAYETRAIISLLDPEAAGLSVARALASHPISSVTIVLRGILFSRTVKKSTVSVDRHTRG
jgi:hypothetical protein